MAEKLLNITSLSKSFMRPTGPQDVLVDINLDVYEGEIVAILGKSGCGKSTLLRMIADLETPTSGKVEIYDQNPNHPFEVSMIFQNVSLFPWFNILENIKLGMNVINISDEEKNQKAL